MWEGQEVVIVRQMLQIYDQVLANRWKLTTEKIDCGWSEFQIHLYISQNKAFLSQILHFRHNISDNTFRIAQNLGG